MQSSVSTLHPLAFVWMQADAVRALRTGDSFTGMSNAEQDGRYLSGFANQMDRPAGGQTHPDRELALEARGSELRRNYLQFHRHFQKMTDDLGSRMDSVNSLWFPHYFAKTGLYTALGAEIAQSLPNAQIFYSFLRGAGKQYGKTWWSTPSIWNTWGEKTCTSASACSNSGTSLSLLRRLMYSQILYRSQFFCFEWAWTFSDPNNPPFNRSLTPIGKLQVAGKQFVETHEVGTHLANAAVLLDFYSGYAPPRHMYTGFDSYYRSWGNLPFASADYFAHGILDMIYPG